MSHKVLIAGFKHETNTFSVLPTDLAAYKARALHRGAEVVAAYAGTRMEIAAFLDGCRRHGWTPILSLVADATPSGKLTRDCYETLANEIVADSRTSQPDAILLNLHGAMVAEHLFDGEGELLARLRAAVGPKVIIAATLDLHANVTDQMAREADILVSYRTYPHVDLYEIAEETVEILAQALAGTIKPRTVVRRGPQIVGLDDGRTTAPGPMTEALDKIAALKHEPGVLAASVNAGFYKADIPEVGPSAVIVGDGDDPRFAGMAETLVAQFWDSRHRSTITHATVAEGIACAKATGRAGSPVILADFADNPGGGGYSDSTGLLRAMIEAGFENAAMSAIFDPACAAACHAAGVGATLSLDIGGKIDPSYGAPIRATGTVTHVSDGRFAITGPMMTGMRVDMGKTATFKVGGVAIVLGSVRYQNYDLGYFRIGGIEPKDCAVLAVKSMQHFRAVYAPLASDIVIVDEGGGVTSHDIRRLPFQHVRRPVYPLDLA